MTNKSAFIYDNYNARVLSYKQLSKTFIPNRSFFELAGQNNTVVIGPRGSGKTTLLKMLQIEALSLWEGEKADESRTNINYTGVFVPTDIIWYKQQKKLLETNKNAELVTKYINDLFILHTFECLLQALIYRVNSNKAYRHISLTYEEERDIVKALSSQWKLVPEVSSIKGLYAAVTLKSSNLLRLAADKDFSNASYLEGNICNFLDITQSLSASIKQINNMINENDGCWCFLFDELELAPTQITSDLINAMRGSNPSIIYKLSLSPYNENISSSITFRDAMESQDFSIVFLPDSQDTEFAEKLCEKVFTKNNLSLDVIEKSETTDYRKEFSELAKKDKSFSDYLTKKRISIERIIDYTDKDKRPEIRKIRWSVLIRNYYFDDNLSLRSVRRPADFYAGFDNICNVLEYNPRLLIGTMNKLVQHYKNGKIDFPSQINALKNASNAFHAILNTISVDSDNYNTLKDLIQKISTQICQKYILGKKFYDEPKGVFYFKQEPKKEIATAFGDALNTGAIISINDKNTSEFNISKFVGKKFRISYIFSPVNKLPLTKLASIEFYQLVSGEIISEVDELLEKAEIQMEFEL